jgi:hypothetical protein
MNKIKAVILALLLTTTSAYVVLQTIPTAKSQTITITQYTIYNPYEGLDFVTVNQYKSNLHTHTMFGNFSDAQGSGEYRWYGSDGNGYDGGEAAIYYGDTGNYDILALTEHKVDNPNIPGWANVTLNTWPWSWFDASLVPCPDYEANESHYPTVSTEFYSMVGPEGMLAVQGNEPSSGHHMAVLLCDANHTGTGMYSMGPMLDYIVDNDGLAYFAHPGTYNMPLSYYNDLFDSYRSILLGVAIYNKNDQHGTPEQCSHPYDSDRHMWDAINGERSPDDLIWAFSEDDTHYLTAAFRSYNRHFMYALNETEFRNSITNGQFYCSYEGGGNTNPEKGIASTPALNNVVVHGTTITVTGCDRTDTIEWYNNKTEIVGTGNSLDVTTLENDTNFVRANLVNDTYGVSHTQPFGIETQDIEVDIIEFKSINNVTNTSTVYEPIYLLNWTKVETALYYHLQIANDSSFNDVCLNLSYINATNYAGYYVETQSELQEYVEFTLPEAYRKDWQKTYYFRVRAYAI